MNISICITVLNEEHSIKKLLDSLLNQTVKAKEIVIVDAGSSDNTVKIIKTYPNIKLIISKNASIAKGRNLAVLRSKNDIIAMTDAGCVAKKDWLEKITDPFLDKGVDAVAGFYLMTGKSDFQKSLKPYLGVLPKNFNKHTFLPSARSIAFRKSVWEKLGGFNERFERAGEDHEFALKIKNLNLNIAVTKKAIVYWEMPDNLIQAIKKFYLYSKGDAQSPDLLMSHNIHTLTIFVRYFVFAFSIFLSFINSYFIFAFLTLIFVYFLWSYLKAGLWGIIIQISSDVAIMLGFIYGLFSKNI